MNKIKTFVVVLISGLLLALPARGSEGAATQSLSYLALHADLRATELSLIDAKAQLKAARIRAEEERSTFLDDLKLASSEAISRYDVQLQRLYLQLSQLRIQQWRKAITSLEGQLAYDVFLLKATAGAAVDLKKAYAVYQAGWKAQCDKADADVASAQAEQDFHSYALGIARSLPVGEGTTTGELSKLRANYDEAVVQLDSAKKWAEQCVELLPTLDFLTQLDHRSK